MNKRIIALCCILTLTLSLVACGKNKEEEPVEVTETTETETTTIDTPDAADKIISQEDTDTTEKTETVDTPEDNAAKLAEYVAEAKKTPKAIHYIVSKRTTDENGVSTKHTYFVIVYDSLKTIIYSMIDDNSANSGRCDRYINNMDASTYATILDRLPNKDIFEPLVEGTDYTREISMDENTEVYKIINTNIIYKDDTLFDATDEFFNVAFDDNNDFTPENLSQCYGSYDSRIYPYSPYSSWTDTIDTWLEEYIYDVCTCFDMTIEYD